MSRKLYLLIGTTILVCGLLLGAVVLTPGSGTAGKADLLVEAPEATPDGMVWIAGGSFVMGTPALPVGRNPDRIKADEYPAHPVELDGYWMDATPVTNTMYAEFVAMTGYVTFAEKNLTKADFAARGVDTSAFPDEMIKAGSLCLNCEFDRKSLITGVTGWEYQVWHVVEGADWRHPDGPESTIDDRMDHPVVHVAWEDAVAYCKWAGKRLPTEAEFEFASRNRGQDIKYPWGQTLVPDGKYLANFWQGEFPLDRRNEDGYLVTSPVRAFPPNPLGLYDIAGNVWEWCSDLYHEEYYSISPRKNPQGPNISYDSSEPGLVKRVQRGGSFLCNTNNCTGYRTRARMRGDVASSSFHNGFRCVLDPSMMTEYRNAQRAIAAWRAEQAPSEASLTSRRHSGD